MATDLRLRDNPTHELYCTLCGVPFWLYLNLGRGNPENGPDDLAWTGYFLARKSLEPGLANMLSY